MTDEPIYLSNIPDLASTLSKESMDALIDAELEPLRRLAERRIDMCQRFIAKHSTVEDDETDALAAEVLAVCQALAARIEKAREVMKAPILAAGNAIGSDKRGPFADLADTIKTASAPIRQAATDYKQEIERKRLAEVPMFEETSTADLTRAHGDNVGVTSLARRRTFTITDPALVPRLLCIPSDSLIRAAIGKTGDPIPSIPGIAISDEATLTVRK